ncbi:hypothetical protein IRB23SM22_07950 [Alkalibacterium sp. s-m-22]
MADLENQNVDAYMELINDAYREFEETLDEIDEQKNSLNL